MSRDKTIAGVSWLAVFLLVAAFLGPVWKNYSGSVIGPFGGIDALMQLGILEWSARHWSNVSSWYNLPIFYPVPGSLGFMDSLLGQAWLVLPVRWLFSPTAAGLYNTAYLGSLLLGAMAMATLWIASGGSRSMAGVAALALLGAPFTHAQIGHLNQLPPPFVLFSLAALTAALRRHRAGFSSGRFWWLLGGGLIMQAAWGWYGFAYLLVGVAVFKIVWLVEVFQRKEAGGAKVLSVLKNAIVPFLIMAAAVWFLAQPQLNLNERYSGFQRSTDEVVFGSADIQHFLNRGVYRSDFTDWMGQGATGLQRYEGRDRQVLHPGWLALALFSVGWWRRDHLSKQRQRFGRAVLVMGLMGLVLAFGESIGLPGTDRRLPLPLDLLREILPPFKAFRYVWRFSWLMVIALAWWSAVGVEMLAGMCKKGTRYAAMPVLLVVMLFLLSLPAAIPLQLVPMDGRPGPLAMENSPVLTLPAPAIEYDEDRTEALWLLRSLTTGQPVTGGVSGWVPPETITLRQQLLACEQGRESAHTFLENIRSTGIVRAEIALRPGDEKRTAFWREALTEWGAVRDAPWPQAGYEMYRF